MTFLSGKVAFVTGGARGLGEAIGRRFLREGAKVVFADLDFADKQFQDHLQLKVDVSNDQQVATAISTSVSAFGRLDILVANAGYGGGGLSNAEDVDLGQWDKTFAVNVRGVMSCIKHSIPHLKAGGGGSIIVVSSISALRPIPFQTAYGASKAASVAIARSVSQEVGIHNIRVNALCPGPVDTELFRGNSLARANASGTSLDDEKKRIARLSSMRRLTTVEEIAATALFLASSESSAMTGEIVKVDCGTI